jgi:hypothetical protein
MSGRPLSNTMIRTLNLVPKTAGGKPAKIQAGSITGESSDTALATVEVAADGASARLIPVDGAESGADANGVPIEVVFTFSGDADLGAGVRTVGGTYSCVIVAEEATGIEPEEAADTPKP